MYKPMGKSVNLRMEKDLNKYHENEEVLVATAGSLKKCATSKNSPGLPPRKASFVSRLFSCHQTHVGR